MKREIKAAVFKFENKVAEQKTKARIAGGNEPDPEETAKKRAEKVAEVKLDMVPSLEYAKKEALISVLMPNMAKHKKKMLQDFVREGIFVKTIPTSEFSYIT
jgi:hypothetical protein